MDNENPKTSSRSKRDRETKERNVVLRAQREAQNRIDRPDCTMPRFTALTAYQKGCRCAQCVEARRALSRRCQKAAYAADPAKFSARQREYLARKKQGKTDAAQ